jgi:tRNA pseudouridine38-40 synthase
VGRIKLILSYDGTDFCGWQKQKDHAFGPDLPSIQESVEKALADILQHPVALSGSGRTDAGVHALGQVAHFDSEKNMPKDLCWALASKLPKSIVAKEAFLAPDDFHATISAEKKIYRYWIWNNTRPTALLGRYTWNIRKELRLDYLNECSKFLLGEKDFASFRTMGTPVKHTIRQIHSAEWIRLKPSLIQFTICGNGFMKQMVRNIVGTLADLDLKSQPIEKIDEIIKSKSRQKAGPTAPPQGLSLVKVYYPQTLDKRCRRL